MERRGRGNRAKGKGGGQHTYVVLKRHLSFIHITQWELITVTNYVTIEDISGETWPIVQ